MYLSMDSKSVSVCERFPEDIGAFEYLPIGLRELQMSKSLSIMRINLQVASLPSNSGIFFFVFSKILHCICHPCAQCLCSQFDAHFVFCEVDVSG